MGFGTHDIQQGYDRIAAAYAARLAGELQHKPFDRALLERFAALVRGQGLVCDVGCGPGHITHYLAQRGVAVMGLDLSRAMLHEAQRRNPELAFVQGTMTQLGVADHSLAAIVAFYSLIHIPRSGVVAVLHEFARAIKPGGQLLLAVHIGDHELHMDEWWGAAVSIDTSFFQPAEIAAYLRAAGFTLQELIERDPLPEVEYQSRRCYALAHSQPGEISKHPA